MRAYGVSDYSLSGPDWMGSVKVDVVAKPPASAAGLSQADQYRMSNIMLQGLLAERFKLKVHREEKVIPGYVLVVAPGGPKMRRVGAPQPGSIVMPGRITAQGTPVQQISASASGELGGPVRDMTGLSGYYEFNLKWIARHNKPRRHARRFTSAPVKTLTMYTPRELEQEHRRGLHAPAGARRSR